MRQYDMIYKFALEGSEAELNKLLAACQQSRLGRLIISFNALRFQKKQLK